MTGVITQVGPHRVRHGNVMDIGVHDLMDGGDERADVIYSDPPWGDGNLSYWKTMNRKMTGDDSTQPPLVDFLSRIFNLGAVYTTNVMLVEYGVRWQQEIINAGRDRGFHHAGVTSPSYKSGSQILPLHLHVFMKDRMTPISSDWLESLVGTTGLDTVKRAIAPFVVEGGIIADFCCGMGYTAQAAMDAGMVFRGNELNARRLDKTIMRLRRGVFRADAAAAIRAKAPRA